jgi:putative DNA primase/helicase
MSDDLKSKISLKCLIEAAGVELKKRGLEWVGLCPFHGETAPSFGVNEEKGVYHCLGCGASGDAFTWLEEKEGLEFGEARKRLAVIAGVDPELSPQPPRSNGVPAAGAPPALTEKPRDTAYYGYVDEKGRALFEIVRREWLEGGERKKSFLQRYTDQAGRAIWKKHPRQVLFRLDKLGPAEKVYLVEGEKDVLTLEAWGLVATTAPGGSSAKWLPAYTKTLAAKTVYVIPDNDPAGRKHAQKAIDAIAATSKAVLLTLPGPDKSDVTDWRDAGGTPTMLLEFAAQAEQTAAEQQRDQGMTVKLEPNALAARIMTEHFFLSDMNGSLYEYDGHCWRRINPRQLKTYALNYDAPEHTNQRRRNEIADYIDHRVFQREVPWRQIAGNEVPLLNGVFNVETLELRPHQRDDYLETVVPIPYQEQADCPIWRKALFDYFGADDCYEAKVLALQQFFGYTLLPHARYKKALVLFGESDTGKSQVANLLGALVGKENRCAVSVEDMDNPRARVPIVGKMLNVLTELSAKSVVADSGFKTLISTEEPLLIDPKHLPPFMYSPSCKHLIACNSLPSVNDLTRATFGRMLIIKFNRVLRVEEQDRDFFGYLTAELPGILNWGLSGAADLVAHGGQFCEVPESTSIIEEYRRSENEIYAFLDEHTARDPDAYVYPRDVRARFRSWAGRNYTDKAIGAMMRAAGFPTKTVGGDRNRRHYGLAWSDQL